MATEEKPFMEIDEIKRLPNNVAVILPSNGDRTLPATVTYLRPLWIFEKRKNLALETSWFDWPKELRSADDLDTDARPRRWKGWEGADELAEEHVVPPEARLGRFVQKLPTRAEPQPRVYPVPDDVSTPNDLDSEPPETDVACASVFATMPDPDEEQE